MATLHVSAERSIAAPAEVAYRCIADYRQHHAHILPPAFFDLAVEEGGVGAGTVISAKAKMAGRTQAFRQRVAEPEPGRILTESTLGRDQVTTFTVIPDGAGCRVRIETVWQPLRGLAGVAERLFAPRFLRGLYVDELDRLDRYAREQAGGK